MYVAKILFAEESVLILFQFLSHIDDLLIVHQQFADVVMDLCDPPQILILLRVQYRVLYFVELSFIALQDRQIIFDYLLKKVIQEALQARFSPASCAPDGIYHLLRLAAVIDKHDALFIKSEREAEIIRVYILAVRQLEGPRKRVVVDLCLSVVDIP